MRIMALDYGEQRIGNAMTDLLKILASPFDIYHRKHTDEDFEFFLNLIKSQQVDTIVMGLPVNLEGEEQEIATKARAFAQTLGERSGCEVVLVDERMTSVIAEDILKQKYRDWRERKQHLDEVSAMVILQDYLDTL